MNKLFLTAIIGTGLMLSTAFAGIESLRGANDLDAVAQDFDVKKQVKAQGGFKRAWETQPPAIPHSIEKDRITLKENTCMRCHSAENFEKEKSPKVGDSHYIDREGNQLGKLSSRRYFCNQCHVLQFDAKPLVENTFQGSDSQ